MLPWVWVIPALPLCGYLVLGLLGRYVPRAAAGWVAVAATGVSAAIAAAIFVSFVQSPPPDELYVHTLWTWIDVGGLTPRVSLRLDPLSILMALVVTWVGLLILLYSAEYMREEEGARRFFAYMSLFIGSMLILVLAQDLLLLYLGWEGVGLCSYLLIGFWYRDPRNGDAARKAFVVTRIGDAAMAVGLLLLFVELGTLDIQAIEAQAASSWAVGSETATLAAALLLGGAIAKSAQVPLQVWLPDAMAGPTPVSALIHAATMVTAGVFLIARFDVVFGLAPAVMDAIAAIGAVTLLVGGLSALAQYDIKRVLAYSTVSQLGYMFVALGVGAYQAAIFHLVTHAFFKALLFLAAGAVIHTLGGEHDLFRMGGLRRRIPVTFWTMVIGGASLAGLPLVTAGFYSKDLILYQAYVSEGAGPLLFACGLFGTFVTALYIFRAIFLAFLGRERGRARGAIGLPMKVSMIALAALSIFGGFIQTPETLGGFSLLSDFVGWPLDHPFGEGEIPLELLLELAAAGVAVLGVYVAYRRYVRGRELLVAGQDLPATPPRAQQLFRIGLGFDFVYRRVIIRPFSRLAWRGRDDFLDTFYEGVAVVFGLGYRALSRTQTGQLRVYVAALALGAVLFLLLVVLA